MRDNKKIVVTGGAGYIGSHTVVELIDAGYTPVIIDNFSNSDMSAIGGICEITQTPVTLYEGDCRDEDFVAEVFKMEESIAGCIHFAAHKSVEESVAQPMKYYRNNIDSLLVLMGVMKACGVVDLVFSSSCTVYGQPDTLPVTEETPLKEASSPYGETKKICERIIEDEIKSSSGLKAISLRYFNPIGAHPSSHIGEWPIGVPSNLVPFVTQTAAGLREELVIYGDDYPTPDGTCIRDYLHVVDLARAHVKALQFAQSSPVNRLEVFNLGMGEGKSVRAVINTFERATGQEVNCRVGTRRAGDIEKIYANADKAKSLLDWKAELSLEDALRDAWNWQKRCNANQERA